MLTSELITKNNLKESLSLQNLIFPRENAKLNYIEAIEERKKSTLPVKFQNEYFLVRNENKKPVGDIILKEIIKMNFGLVGLAFRHLKRKKDMAQQFLKSLKSLHEIMDFPQYDCIQMKQTTPWLVNCMKKWECQKNITRTKKTKLMI